MLRHNCDGKFVFIFFSRKSLVHQFSARLRPPTRQPKVDADTQCSRPKKLLRTTLRSDPLSFPLEGSTCGEFLQTPQLTITQPHLLFHRNVECVFLFLFFFFFASIMSTNKILSHYFFLLSDLLAACRLSTACPQS